MKVSGNGSGRGVLKTGAVLGAILLLILVTAYFIAPAISPPSTSNLSRSSASVTSSSIGSSSSTKTLVTSFTCGTSKQKELIVQTDGVYYDAVDGSSCEVVLGGPDNLGGANGSSASSVLAMAGYSLAGGGRILVKAGSYRLSSPVYFSVSNVTLEGVGNQTYFSVVHSFNATPMTVAGSNWRLDSFEFNAQGVVRGHAFSDIAMTGMNDTVVRTFETGGDHGQIRLAGRHNSAIANVVTNSTDDGIIIIDAAYDKVVDNRVVKTTNHNCISLVGPSVGVQISGNFCENSGSHGIAVESLGLGTNNNAIISNNTVYRSAYYGIRVYPEQGGLVSAENLVVSDNFVAYAGSSGQGYSGIEVESGGDITIVGNTVMSSSGSGISFASGAAFNSTIVVSNEVISPAENGIYIQGTAPSADISYNNISGLSSGEVGIKITGAADNCSLEGNIVSFSATGNRSDYSNDEGVLFLSTPSDYCVISHNTFVGIGRYGDGVFIDTANDGTVIARNTFDSWSYAILLEGSADYNQVYCNQVSNVTVFVGGSSGPGDNISTRQC